MSAKSHLPCVTRARLHKHVLISLKKEKKVAVNIRQVFSPYDKVTFIISLYYASSCLASNSHVHRSGCNLDKLELKCIIL